MDSLTCRNCGESITKNFCSNCGEQQYKRIEMKDMVGDFLSNVVTLEGPILQTVKDLTIRPGKMINAYVNGKRKGYYKPFQYYILASTVYFLFFYLWDNEIMTMISNIGADANTYATTEEITSLQKEMTEFQGKNMKFFTFLQIPIYSWLIWLFFKKKSGHSYTETLLASLYILSQTLFFGIVFTLFEFFSTGISIMLSGIFMFIYIPWTLKQLYNETMFKTILKSTAIIALAFALYGILMAIISLIWVAFLR
ncbi:MAG: DUF3667 domain-containing protein [Vicingaceae bacterium]|nr:DUF3667 domain-containing protein [Vicingaceae bacterium]